MEAEVADLKAEVKRLHAKLQKVEGKEEERKKCAPSMVTDYLSLALRPQMRRKSAKSILNTATTWTNVYITRSPNPSLSLSLSLYLLS